MCELLVFLVGDEYFVPKILFSVFSNFFIYLFSCFYFFFLASNKHSKSSWSSNQVFAQHVLLKRLNATKHVQYYAHYSHGDIILYSSVLYLHATAESLRRA